MKIALIDVDAGLNPAKAKFPNLALMRISAYHKSRGDTVEWWWSDLIHYDIVYMSKVFSDAYTKDIPPPPQTLTWLCAAVRDTPSPSARTAWNTSTPRSTKISRLRSKKCFRTTPYTRSLISQFP